MKKIVSLLLIICVLLCLSACGDEEQPKQCAHSFAVATCTTPQRCSICGVTVGSALGHNWEDATCYSKQTCNRCGATEGLLKAHKYENGYCVWCYNRDPNLIDVKTNKFLTIEQINFDINSADGVEVDIEFTNQSNKQIAYIYFTIKFYDRMGSPAYCSIKDTHTQRLKFTGPVNAGTSDKGYWDPLIYNSATAAVKPLSIEIEYTDGTNQTLTSDGRYWYSSSYYGGDLKD